MPRRPWIPAAPFLLASATAALALEGRVVEESGRPVANAEVTILGRTAVARTDAEGRFVLKPDPQPPFEVLVILPGERLTKPILIASLPAEGPLEIRLAPVIEEQMTVTAGVAPDIESSPAAAATLLSQADLETRQPANLSQALENVPGVGQISEGQAAVPAIRGLARGRTLVLIDGARVTSERRVGPSATYLDPFSLEALEVARGPGGVAYGSDAFGGVIQARTRRPVPGSPWELRLQGGLGAGAPQRRLGLEVSRGFSEGGILLQGHDRDFDDYRSPEGDIFNSGATDRGFLVRVEEMIGEGLFSVGLQSDFGRNIDRPRTNSRQTRFHYPTEDSHRVTASYERGATGRLDRLSLSSFLGNYRLITDQDTFATATTPRAIARADVEANDFHVRALARKLAGPARVDFGADVNGRFDLNARDVTIDFDLAGNEASTLVDETIENARRFDTGLFVSAEGAVAPRFSLGGGGRVDRVSTRNRGGYFGDRSASHTALSGYAAASLGSFGGYSVTLQVSRGFRDPVLSDRYFRGVTGRGFITGNPDLEPETSIQYDAALRYTAGRWRWGLYVYEYRIDRLIERYEDTPDFFLFRNRDRARIRGAEAEVRIEAGRRSTLEMSAFVQRGLALDDDTPLDDIAPATFTAQLRRSLGTRGFAQVRVAACAADHRPGPTEVGMPRYWVLDASGGWNVSNNVEIRFIGRNLLDKVYPVSPDSRAVLAPGISGMLTVSLRL